MFLSRQFVITWISIRSQLGSYLIKGKTLLLIHRGEMLRGTISGQRAIEAGLLQVVREQGLASLEGVEAILLEKDETSSVVKKSTDSGECTALAKVEKPSSG